jgi:hypothetical protein
MLHQSGKNNKLGSVKNSRGFIQTLQADFSKGFDIGFFQRCLRRFTKDAFKAKK